MASTFASLRLDFSLTTTWLHRNDHLQMRKERCERIAQVKSTTGNISVVSEDQNDSVVDRLDPIARTYSFSFLHLFHLLRPSTFFFYLRSSPCPLPVLWNVVTRYDLVVRSIRVPSLCLHRRETTKSTGQVCLYYNRIRKINLFEVNIWNDLSIREMQSLRAKRESFELINPTCWVLDGGRRRHSLRTATKN